VDVFHLVAPGTLFAHDAAAVVAWTPAADVVTGAAGQPVVRFAAASDLHGLSARFGAWATVLSAYGTDVSRIALRVVADQIARSRPGPVALHDVARDRSGQGAAALYRFLQAPPPADVPADRAVSLYTHPARVGVAAPTTQVAPGLAEAFRNVAAATGRAAPEGGAQEALPSWLGAAQRYLEQCASNSLKEQPRTAADHAAHEGVASALSFLSNVVAGAAEAAERSAGRGAHTEES
jgi:hypothetical protein